MIGRLITGLCAVYLAAFGLFIVLLALPLRLGSWFDGAALMLPLLFLPLLVIGMTARMLRARSLQWSAAGLAMVGILHYSPTLIPKTQIDTPAPNLNVYSYNIGGLRRLSGEFLIWLQERPFDVVLVQESHHAPRYDRSLNSPDQIIDVYPYWVTQETARGYRGNLLLSRYPILEADGFDLEDETDPDSFTRAVIDFHGQPIAIYNISLPTPIDSEVSVQTDLPTILNLLMAYDDTERDERLQALLVRLEMETLPYIVAGDFNMTDTGWGYSRMTELAIDSYREAGQGYGATFPISDSPMPPLLRIDYIFHSTQFRTVTAALSEPLGSDHLPVMATLELNTHVTTFDPSSP